MSEIAEGHLGQRLDPSEVTKLSERDPRYFGWRVALGAVVGLALSPGPVSLLLIGSLAPVFLHAHGWSIAHVMFGLTLINIASIVVSPFIGWLIDRLSVRIVLLMSIAAMAGCLLAWGYWVSTLTQFYAVCVVFGLTTLGAQSVSYNKLLVEWFDQSRGLALGIAAAGLGLGFSILPGIIAFGFAKYGPSGTTLLVVAILLVCSFGLNSFVAIPPKPEMANRTKIQLIETGLSIQEAIKTSAFWLLAAVIFLMSVVVTGMVPQIVSLGRDLHYSMRTVAIISTIFGLVTLLGRLAIGWLFDRVSAIKVAALTFVLTALGCVVVAVGAYRGSLPWPIMAAGIASIGLGYGAESDLNSYLTGKYFGRLHFGMIYGVLLAVFLLGVSIGPLMYGTVRQLTGGYGSTFLVGSGLSIVSAMLMLCLPHYRSKPPQQ
jgi:MFS family permease